MFQFHVGGCGAAKCKPNFEFHPGAQIKAGPQRFACIGNMQEYSIAGTVTSCESIARLDLCNCTSVNSVLDESSNVSFESRINFILA